MSIDTSHDSLTKRYWFKLATNITGVIISLFTQLIVPRSLGPGAYGNFNFLSNFFTQVVGFLDMGTSTAFYTKLSQRPSESKMVFFYLRFSGLISGLLLVFVVIASFPAVRSLLWPGQELKLVYVAALWAMLTWFVQILASMADAYGLTVHSETAKFFQKTLGLFVIYILYFFNLLDLPVYFYYNCFFLVLLGYAYKRIMDRRGFPLNQRNRPSPVETRGYIDEYYRFSHPLFVYSVFGTLTGLLDQWLLLNFNGSVQQGYYGLAYQMGALCFLFTGAMTPILLREFSFAFGNSDLGQIAVLFRRYIPMLYAIAAFFSCFVATQADKVTLIVGGSKYIGAELSVLIMAFYPLHQTYGQLSGSVFLATGQTRLYRNIGIVLMSIGAPLSFFILAPARYGGLEAGATGLAIKMVLLNAVWVNVQLYFNARFLKFVYVKYLGHQVLSVGFLLVFAIASTLAVNAVIDPREHMVSNFILAGVLYTALVAGATLLAPVLFGVKKDDLRALPDALRKRLRKE